MSEATTRALELVAQLRAHLDQVEQTLKSGTVPDQKVLILESMLIDRRWRPDIMGVTGPSGYDPKPVYEKCPNCTHYRLK
jgi:hypothetical protein